MRLELDFLKKKGDEFQDFFSKLMELRFPGDFVRVRPWGKLGDKKNDGYHKSARRLFQAYGPDDLSAKEAIAKIDEDFNEALPHWQQYFSTWTFVHNAKNGLGPHILQKLLELGSANAQLTINHFGYPEFRGEVFQLSTPDIGVLLGPVPSQTNFTNLSFAKLQPVLLAVSKQAPALEPDIRPVPPDKLKANSLSSNVELLLRAGMSKSDLVGGFFEKWTDPTLGDQVAEAFSEKYKALKAAGLPPDSIFMELHVFAGGDSRKDPDHEAAVLAVLAHFFEECDIFERPTTLAAGAT